MKVYVSNAFSLSMLDRDQQRGTPNGYVPRSGDRLAVAKVLRPLDDPKPFLAAAIECGIEVVSIIGHADTANVLSEELGLELPANRVSIKLADQDVLIVGQYIGARLPEGATRLPEGAVIEWWVVG